MILVQGGLFRWDLRKIHVQLRIFRRIRREKGVEGSMLSIAICDDEAEYVQQTVNFIREYLDHHPAESGQIHAFQRGQELLYQVEETGGFDLYLLDIIMPGLNGIQTGQQLRELGDGGEIIYLTTSADYAIDSYSVRAFFYLLKPIEKERLFAVLDAATEKLNHRRQKAVLITTKDGPRRVLLDQILYVERVGRGLRYYCSGGTVDSISLRVPFHTAVENLLADPRFCQCGSSFAFNLQHVAGVRGQEVLLDSGRSVAIPRASVPGFKHAWGSFWLEEDRT